MPEVLEVRRGNPDADLPGVLVTSLLPGERLDLVLPGLEDQQQAVVGAHLGTIVGPKHPHNMAWGDPDGRTLYLCARSSLYRIRLNVPGVRPQ